MVHPSPLLANATVAVIGLGYVALPLALAFGRVLPTIGFVLAKPS